MSRRNIKYKKSHPFDIIWCRIQKTTPVKTQKQLAEIVETSQSNISKRRSENNFPIEWAFNIAQSYDLSTDWIMTGEGAMDALETGSEFENGILHDIDRWLGEQIKEEPFRKEWFKGSFLDAFPLFAKWKKSQGQEERQDTSIQNKAA